jgi:hypothetical protein
MVIPALGVHDFPPLPLSRPSVAALFPCWVAAKRDSFRMEQWTINVNELTRQFGALILVPRFSLQYSTVDTWNTCQSESNLRLKNKAELWQFLPVSARVFHVSVVSLLEPRIRHLSQLGSKKGVSWNGGSPIHQYWVMVMTTVWVGVPPWQNGNLHIISYNPTNPTTSWNGRWNISKITNCLESSNIMTSIAESLS